MESFGITFGIAFLAGVATFFSPCIAPVLPGFFAFLGKNIGKKTPSRFSMMVATTVFLLGFLLILFLLGTGAHLLGQPLSAHRRAAEIIGGIFLIILGLLALNVLRIPLLLQEHRFAQVRSSSRFVRNFFFGITFGFAWTPCIGPVLGTLLFLATQEENAQHGGILLLFFGLGFSLPFLVLSLFVPEIIKITQKIKPLVRLSKMFIGGFLILLGLLLLSGKLGELSGFFTSRFGTGFVF